MVAGWLGLSSPALAQWEETGANGEKTYALKGAETCLKCHDKAPATNMLHTAHAAKGDSRSPFAQHACESCHGASPEHLRKVEGQPRALPAVVYRKDSPNTVEERNGMCATCHQGGKLMNWSGSQHQSNDVTCVDCHGLHTTKDPATSRQDMPNTCFKCHAEQRAQTLRPSHHPIREGQTVCSDCHNPHGSPTQKMLLGRTVNDTCYKCHAETRGPFLWEHAPVREDCTICHSPHGTVQPALLKQRAPFLCQECHMMVGGHSNQLLSNGNGGNDQRIRGKSCMNCHSQIHGSNHPSGPRFMR
ncbi:MAG: DmsE family decaheme c-type cytochrome [Rhodospirillaceae bacterium]|nr:DmsE family decaheme c-type cytochrome [Rhodospirillales bacterium]